MHEEMPTSTTAALRLTALQHAYLRNHLFPGDGKEAAAIALCGKGEYETVGRIRRVVCVYQVHAIPHEDSARTVDRITWRTEALPDILATAERRGMVILKIHSHPGGYERFSEFDDQSDRELFEGVAGWLDTDQPGLSAIMLESGRILARAVSANGTFSAVDRVLIAGPDIQIWDRHQHSSQIPELDHRTKQAFGTGTTELLSRLTIGVVGCSGTGSPVIEQLYRLGVGEIVLVDPQGVGKENVRRIMNSTVEDAANGRSKVGVLKTAIQRSGLPTNVISIQADLFDPLVVRQLAQCDVLFGCMDSIDGRDLLNRLAVYYAVPYFDVGVKLVADGEGGVEQVCGSVHYLQPDGSSLLSRGVYTPAELAEASLLRDDPAMHTQQLADGYIRGVAEAQPAVISVNCMAASYAVNDFLARIHPFRDEANGTIATIRFSLTQTRMLTEPEGIPCPTLSHQAGRGDARPLLGSPALSEQ